MSPGLDCPRLVHMSSSLGCLRVSTRFPDLVVNGSVQMSPGLDCPRLVHMSSGLGCLRVSTRFPGLQWAQLLYAIEKS